MTYNNETALAENNDFVLPAMIENEFSSEDLAAVHLKSLVMIRIILATRVRCRVLSSTTIRPALTGRRGQMRTIMYLPYVLLLMGNLELALPAALVPYVSLISLAQTGKARPVKICGIYISCVAENFFLSSSHCRPQASARSTIL